MYLGPSWIRISEDTTASSFGISSRQLRLKVVCQMFSITVLVYVAEFLVIRVQSSDKVISPELWLRHGYR